MSFVQNKKTDAAAVTAINILELICSNQPGGSELAEIIRPARGNLHATGCSAAKDGDHSLRRTILANPSGLYRNVRNSWDAVRMLPSSEVEDARRPSSFHLHATLDEDTNNATKANAPVKMVATLGSTGIPRLEPALTDAGVYRCLHDELHLAGCVSVNDDWTCGGRAAVRGLVQRGIVVRGGDSDRLSRLARAIETDEFVGQGEAAAALAAARCLAVRLRLLTDEARDLRDNVAEIHDDIQDALTRATTASCSARALAHETRALAFLDDVLVLLRADPARTRAVAARRGWPFAPDPTFARPHGNYVV